MGKASQKSILVHKIYVTVLDWSILLKSGWNVWGEGSGYGGKENGYYKHGKSDGELSGQRDQLG